MHSLNIKYYGSLCHGHYFYVLLNQSQLSLLCRHAEINRMASISHAFAKWPCPQHPMRNTEFMIYLTIFHSAVPSQPTRFSVLFFFFNSLKESGIYFPQQWEVLQGGLQNQISGEISIQSLNSFEILSKLTDLLNFEFSLLIMGNVTTYIIGLLRDFIAFYM